MEADNREVLAVANQQNENRPPKTMFICTNRCRFVVYYIFLSLDILFLGAFFVILFTDMFYVTFLIFPAVMAVLVILYGFIPYGFEITVNYVNNTVTFQNINIHLICSRCRKPLIFNRNDIKIFFYQKILKRHLVSVFVQNENKFIILINDGSKSKESYYKSLPKTLYQFVFDKEPPSHFSFPNSGNMFF